MSYMSYKVSYKQYGYNPLSPFRKAPRMTHLPTLLDRLTATAGYLHRHAATAQKQLRRELSLHDGFPSTSSAAGGTGGGSRELTSVEAAAAARIDGVRHTGDELVTLIANALDAANRAAQLVDRHLPPPDRGTEARCTGGGNLRGALEWGRPDCDAIGTSRRQGLCDACYARYSRWKRQPAA